MCVCIYLYMYVRKARWGLVCLGLRGKREKEAPDVLSRGAADRKSTIRILPLKGVCIFFGNSLAIPSIKDTNLILGECTFENSMFTFFSRKD